MEKSRRLDCYNDDDAYPKKEERSTIVARYSDVAVAAYLHSLSSYLHLLRLCLAGARKYFFIDARKDLERNLTSTNFSLSVSADSVLLPSCCRYGYFVFYYNHYYPTYTYCSCIMKLKIG